MKKPDKNTANVGKLITAECASVGFVCIRSNGSQSGRLEYNCRFVGPEGWGVRGSEQKFGCNSVHDNWDGLMV